MKHPPYLKNGDLVRIVSPAGVIDPNWIDGAVSWFESCGFSVRVGTHAKSVLGRFAGSSTERCNDLQEALDDPDCGAILCSRGGYGTVQFMENLRWDGFLNRPKWLIGFSDITMLHTLVQQLGWASVHGGMAKALSEAYSGKGQAQSESARLLESILRGHYTNRHSNAHPLNRIGSSEGMLRGGNLSILYSLRGTPYDFIPAGSILFIEDIGEKPYVIDRMLHNLKLGGVLQHLSGLIVGQFTDYEEDPLFGKNVCEIVAEAVSRYDYPVCFDFPVGHVDRNLPLVCGSMVHLEVNTEKTTLKWII